MLLSILLPASLSSPAVLGQFHYQRLKSFGFPNESGEFPNGLIQGSDGALYGTTRAGGTNNAGIAFKLNKDGNGYAALHYFTGGDGDGSQPAAELIEGSDGALYGTTAGGGTNNLGTVFRMNKNGSGYRTLHHFFEGWIYDHGRPQTALVEGKDGALYGTSGIWVFKMAKDGTGFTNLCPITGFLSTLIEGSDGALYGRTHYGGYAGISAFGTVFKVLKDGSGYTVLHSFTGTNGDGRYGMGPLVEGSDGALYGTTYGGGSNDAGTVFKLNKGGSGYRVLRSFSYGGGDAGFPERSGLTPGADGALYGITGYGGTNGKGAIYKLNNDGTGYAVLLSFTKPNSESAGVLSRGSDGTLYGTTAQGGTHNFGTAFKLDKDGSGHAVIFSFTGAGGDGRCPRLAMLLGSDGALYGKTTMGGTNQLGTVFTLNPNGSGYRVLHHFDALPFPEYSEGGLVEGNDGALYGVTIGGGTAGDGTVFKLNKDGGGYTVLRSFAHGGVDGFFPQAALMAGAGGVLYGTTPFGGGSDYSGTVFKLNQDGSGYAVLHRFFDIPDSGPKAALIQGSDGALYGTTDNGGSNRLGTVFRLNTDGGGFAVLRHFPDSAAEASPRSIRFRRQRARAGRLDWRLGRTGIFMERHRMAAPPTWAQCSKSPPTASIRRWFRLIAPTALFLSQN